MTWEDVTPKKREWGTSGYGYCFPFFQSGILWHLCAARYNYPKYTIREAAAILRERYETWENS